MTTARSKFHTGEVIQNYAWTDRLYSLSIRADLQPFKAGQFLSLQLPVDGDDVAKPYSLVNAPQESDIEVLYNRVADGQLSKALAALEPGDQVEFSQPANGFFVLDEVPPSQHLWMIATGSGLGPYISILKTDEPWKRFEKIVLVHGVALTEELVFAELIQRWQREHPTQFEYVSCVTREQNPAGLHGRVTSLLDNGALEEMVRLNINSETSQVMLCGNQSMIDDMKAQLAKRGMKKNLRRKPGHITTEHYF
jgi:ferredoxin--NADP+ reductase